MEFQYLTACTFENARQLLTGSIPYQMEEMSSLVLLDVSNNFLTGVIDLYDPLTVTRVSEELINTGNVVFN